MKKLLIFFLMIVAMNIGADCRSCKGIGKQCANTYAVQRTCDQKGATITERYILVDQNSKEITARVCSCGHDMRLHDDPSIKDLGCSK